MSDGREKDIETLVQVQHEAFMLMDAADKAYERGDVDQPIDHIESNLGRYSDIDRDAIMTIINRMYMRRAGVI